MPIEHVRLLSPQTHSLINVAHYSLLLLAQSNGTRTINLGQTEAGLLVNRSVTRPFISGDFLQAVPEVVCRKESLSVRVEAMIFARKNVHDSASLI